MIVLKLLHNISLALIIIYIFYFIEEATTKMLKIIKTSIMLFLITASSSTANYIEKEIGHWFAYKKSDEFNSNVSSCHVANSWWIPQTHLNPEINQDHRIQFYVDKKALSSSGTINVGQIALFFEFNTASNNWDISSTLFDDRTDGFGGDMSNVVAKVDGKVVDIFAVDFMQELKGKEQLTYRYQAHMIPNKPINTRSVSLIGFTQAWNTAKKLCNSSSFY